MCPPSAGYTAHLLPGPQVPGAEEELGAFGRAALASCQVKAFWREQAALSFGVHTVCSRLYGCQLLGSIKLQRQTLRSSLD